MISPGYSLSWLLTSIQTKHGIQAIWNHLFTSADLELNLILKITQSFPENDKSYGNEWKQTTNL